MIDRLHLHSLIAYEEGFQEATGSVMGLSWRMHEELFGYYNPEEEMIPGSYKAEVCRVAQEVIVAGVLTVESLAELRDAQAQMRKDGIEHVSRILQWRIRTEVI